MALLYNYRYVSAWGAYSVASAAAYLLTRASRPEGDASRVSFMWASLVTVQLLPIACFVLVFCCGLPRLPVACRSRSHSRSDRSVFLDKICINQT